MSNSFEGTGMTKERYSKLLYYVMKGGPPPEPLTKEEIASGWFYSNEFDGLLVHKSWPEAQYE